MLALYLALFPAVGSGLEGAVDSGKDKGIEMGISPPVNGDPRHVSLPDGQRVVLVEEAYTPLERIERVVVFDSMGETLCGLDEIAVGNACLGPVGGDVIGVQFVQPAAMARRAYDNTFAITPAFLEGVHRFADSVDALADREIVHTAFVRRFGGGERNKSETSGLQTADNTRFEVFSVVLWMRRKLLIHSWLWFCNFNKV